jgi:tRNA A-37 threonylcarbamoyl transferase component Bud32
VPESIRFWETSLAGLDGPDASAAFEYARCLQFEVGFDVDLEEASEFYRLIAAGDLSKSLRHSLRCLRVVNKARLPAVPRRRLAEPRVEGHSQAIRILAPPRMISGYLSSPIGRPIGPVIGRGGSSHVNLVQNAVTGELMALKYLRLRTDSDKISFMREVEVLTALNHPCVLRIRNWTYPRDEQCAEIYTEYAAQGSLEDVLKTGNMRRKSAFWTPTRIGIAICDIVVGMRFVHFRGIVHRDLKPSNILICRNGRALIGDFGSSRFTSDYATLTGVEATVYYAAPEMFVDTEELTPKVDVWAFGLILFEIVAGFAVFERSLAPFEVIRQLRSRHRPIIPEECGEYMDGLIRRCWSDDAAARPSFDDILREFQAREFAILPGLNCDEICGAVERVLTWECTAGMSH